MNRPVIIALPRPAPLLSMNDRDHWRTKARKVKTWRTAVRFAAGHRKPLPPCVVTITLDVVGNLRRDPHNYFSTVKACVDGLVDSGLWENDTPDWVTTTEPVLNVIGRKTVPQVIITLTERAA